MDRDLPKGAIQRHWEDVKEDLEATAKELEADGWTTVTLHTGDATSIPGREDHSPGLDVMVPGNEFERLHGVIEDGAEFTESSVFRKAAGGVVFLVFVFQDSERRVATLFPAFYPQQGTSAGDVAEHALRVGQLDLFIRPLDRERSVTFTIEDPSLVFPET